MEAPKEPDFSAQRWIEAIHASRQADTAVAEAFDPFETQLSSIVDGLSIDEQLGVEHTDDPGVALENRFLGLLAELASEKGQHIEDLLALLDNQAEGMPPADETRYRQFMGLWELAIALAKDEQLTKELRGQC
jgi:hypothetical protein